MTTDPLELIGETIAEKYLVESVVGEGGFAIVYRANHQIWNRPVALKVFKALDEVPAEHRERLLKEFVQEGALLAELSEKSAAIVQARDIGMLTTRRGIVIPYMVLEWLEGRALESILLDERNAPNAAPRTLAQAMALLMPVAQALGLAHQRGIAHRDVKPANVFVLGDPYAAQPGVKLLDFGIAKVVQDAQKMGGSFTKTSGQITSFTPAYGAPEQFSRDYGATGPWTDVFAFALILVELLTGKEPLGGDTLTQLAYASVDVNKRPTPRTLGATVTDEVEAVFLKALAVKADDRFRSVGEFWAALTAATQGDTWETATSRTMLASLPTGHTQPGLAAGALAAVPSPPLAQTGPTFEAPAKKSSVGLVAAVLVVLFAVGGGVAWFAKGGARPPATTPSAAPSVAAVVVADASAAAPGLKCPEDMVAIPGGKFFMGTNPGKEIPVEETPAHPVKLTPYCIDRHEVTVAKYLECSRGKGCERVDGAEARNDWTKLSDQHRKIYDPLCNMKAPDERAQHPVNCVTWEHAAVYCRSLGRALPTEAQWEFAARGLAQARFPWGDEADLAGRLNACGTECLAWGKANDPANYPDLMYKFDDKFVHTAPVGQFKKGASPFGVEDMSGNVFEWVADVFERYPEKVEGVPLDEQQDPTGPNFEKGRERVMRGGAWNAYVLSWLRPTFRFKNPPWYRTHGVGFRCAWRP
ncbi:MAG: SUMF1/EgtB/PvdO family nonheme iron enzyme [Myxococcales bacterium]|nr:SUMF1/EgtB/PvdO family nonheme iron enzyme [Myxococcales bacterium]